MYVQLNIKG